MLGSLAKRLFGSANDRFIKGLHRDVQAVNALEPEHEALSDEALAARTQAFRDRLDGGAKLDSLLVEAFATVREASKRTLGQRHYNVQMMGGMVLHRGMISEMKTGEGKTLVATLAVYLNALSGKGVHVVTVNDYLARRDSEWMGRVYRFLGLTVGCIVPGLDEETRRQAYAADITYGTNNEFGFDYLRDNMKRQLAQVVQRDFNYAIVDEVDSILVDEARTPLIISGPASDSSELYQGVDRIIPKLVDADYEADEKQKSITLTEEGNQHVEVLLGEQGLLKEGSLYDVQNINLVHHVNVALRAHKMFERDRDYIVKDDKVIIIDEFTGRMMEGRRFSDGLHQALEAKEQTAIQQENQTLASITFQNYFRLYPKLAGMTGTAMTEAEELHQIYGLEVIEIPTNVPVERKDMDDEVYRTVAEKEDAIVAKIKDCQERKQPVLVGTVSIEKSEQLARRLKREKIEHAVLNARYHEQEAFIVAQAGAPGAVTIATNMAGRGTDIQLGGNIEMRLAQELAGIKDEDKLAARGDQIRAEVKANRRVVLEAGGLFVLGTERHESRRIDNQLRGRSGRQGDPGGSLFFLSLQDDLMRIFGSERLDGMLTRLGLKEGEAIVHPWVNKALEKAQKKVEARNYEIRKNLLKFDDVMNDQRKVVYEQRRDLMKADDVSDTVKEMRQEVIEDMVVQAIPKGAFAEQWEIGSLHEKCRQLLHLDLPLTTWAEEEGIADEEIRERIDEAHDRLMAERTARFTPAIMRALEKEVLLAVIDKQWKDHLLSLDHLRHGISLRAYAQRDPLLEYKREAFELFEAMLAEARQEVTQILSLIEIQTQQPVPEEVNAGAVLREMHETRGDPALVGAGAGVTPSLKSAPTPARDSRPQRAPVRTAAPAGTALDPNDPGTWGKVARNAPCPCGSGKKYKHCHGKIR
ncbi:MAG: preprotein translocase subunit SecA [Rhodospirillales bacterium]|nr:preprotein translocase subunit SecA [Rhodospirillales bacterium]